MSPLYSGAHTLGRAASKTILLLLLPGRGFASLNASRWAKAMTGICRRIQTGRVDIAETVAEVVFAGLGVAAVPVTGTTDAWRGPAIS